MTRLMPSDDPCNSVCLVLTELRTCQPASCVALRIGFEVTVYLYDNINMEQKGYTPKMSEQSTSEQTMREYFPVYNMKKLINQVDNAQAAVSRSRQKVQNYLKAIVRSPKSKLSSVKRIKTEQTSAHPDTTINPTTCSRRSVGCILNQSNTL